LSPSRRSARHGHLRERGGEAIRILVLWMDPWIASWSLEQAKQLCVGCCCWEDVIKRWMNGFCSSPLWKKIRCAPVAPRPQCAPLRGARWFAIPSGPRVPRVSLISARLVCRVNGRSAPAHAARLPAPAIRCSLGSPAVSIQFRQLQIPTLRLD
jgi:hypothetical protein